MSISREVFPASAKVATRKLDQYVRMSTSALQEGGHLFTEHFIVIVLSVKKDRITAIIRQTVQTPGATSLVHATMGTLVVVQNAN